MTDKTLRLNSPKEHAKTRHIPPLNHRLFPVKSKGIAEVFLQALLLPKDFPSLRQWIKKSNKNNHAPKKVSVKQ